LGIDEVSTSLPAANSYADSLEFSFGEKKSQTKESALQVSQGKLGLNK
jgi:hypothetical protein